MAGEVTVTIVGNLADDPELRYTQGGVAVVSVRVGSTPRQLNRQTNAWEDGETVWVRCTAWREVAENVAQTLTKGTRVIVTGRLKAPSAYQTAQGEARASLELDRQLKLSEAVLRTKVLRADEAVINITPVAVPEVSAAEKADDEAPSKPAAAKAPAAKAATAKAPAKAAKASE